MLHLSLSLSLSLSRQAGWGRTDRLLVEELELAPRAVDHGRDEGEHPLEGGARERDRQRERQRERERERERDLLLAAGSYMAIEARSSSCADVATRNKSLRCVRERGREREGERERERERERGRERDGWIGLGRFLPARHGLWPQGIYI